ncbi:MAG TPA: hypothetical protein VIV40_38820 [Kofleriaceae bacterium]
MHPSRDSLECFGAELVRAPVCDWQWSYSWLTGYWYGPIPLGLITGLSAGAVLASFVLAAIGH